MTIDAEDSFYDTEVFAAHSEVIAYKFQTFAFRLALTPGCFSKCVEAALAPLRYKGIRILSYLDDFYHLCPLERTSLARFQESANAFRESGV